MQPAICRLFAQNSVKKPGFSAQHIPLFNKSNLRRGHVSQRIFRKSDPDPSAIQTTQMNAIEQAGRPAPSPSASGGRRTSTDRDILSSRLWICSRVMALTSAFTRSWTRARCGSTSQDPGGARELLWIERTEGYVKQVLMSYNLDPRDTMIIYSHGGMNASRIEMALAGKEKGLTVIGVTSVANRAHNQPKHSSGKALADIADIVIDNCCPPEDALVEVRGPSGKSFCEFDTGSSRNHDGAACRDDRRAVPPGQDARAHFRLAQMSPGSIRKTTCRYSAIIWLSRRVCSG